jgi:hypothetical protein
MQKWRLSPSLSPCIQPSRPAQTKSEIRQLITMRHVIQDYPVELCTRPRGSAMLRRSSGCDNVSPFSYQNITEMPGWQRAVCWHGGNEKKHISTVLCSISLYTFYGSTNSPALTYPWISITAILFLPRFAFHAFRAVVQMHSHRISQRTTQDAPRAAPEEKSLTAFNIK